MTITYTKDEVTLIGSPLESSVLEDDSVEITLDYEQAFELMELLRVAVELKKDF